MSRLSSGQVVVPGLQSVPAVNPGWVKYTIGFAQLQTAAVTNAVAIFTLPAGGYIQRVVMNVTTPFVGTTTITGSVGRAGSVARYVAVSNLAVAGVSLDGITAPLFESIGSPTVINLNAISTIDNLSLLSAGSVDVYFLVSTLP